MQSVCPKYLNEMAVRKQCTTVLVLAFALFGGAFPVVVQCMSFAPPNTSDHKICKNLSHHSLCQLDTCIHLAENTYDKGIMTVLSTDFSLRLRRYNSV